MLERNDCGTPCNRWHFQLYSCRCCLFQLQDTQHATPIIDTVPSSSTVIPSVKSMKDGLKVAQAIASRMRERGFAVQVNIADKAWKFITEINPGEVQTTDTINSLTDEYQNYCARHGLPLLSADELLGKLTELDNAASGSTG